nr:Na(+)/dicarboxylate cotransporter 3-like [Dermacentor andersoni]
MSVVEEQWKECRSLSHLGIFMPLYLLPLLFLGPKYGGCLYCLLLPLLLWAFNSLPKPVTSLVHLVTVPLLGLMDTERVAHKYLAVRICLCVYASFRCSMPSLALPLNLFKILLSQTHRCRSKLSGEK